MEHEPGSPTPTPPSTGPRAYPYTPPPLFRPEPTAPTAATTPLPTPFSFEQEEPRPVRGAPPEERKIPILTAVLAVVIVVLVLASALLFGQVQSLRSDLREARSATGDVADRVEGVAGDARTGLDRVADVERRLGEVELANDPAKVAAGVQPGVFTIATASELGSGFVVQKEAGASLLLTNFHVVEESWVFGDKTVGVFQEESKTVIGTIERINESFDLALVRVGVELDPLPRSGETVEPGQPVLVVGSPLGLGGSVTSGSISALRSFNAVQFIQFSAPISPGNSGGPVVNATGQVVGIAVSKFIDFGAEGLGFAIPISQLCVQFQIC